MVRDLTLLSGCFSTGLALDHDVKVDEFVCESGHVVLEAEGVFADCVGGEDVVALAFAFSV